MVDVAKTVNIHEAKTHLSKLIERAQAGEEIVIAKSGKPLVRLQVLADSEATRGVNPPGFGSMKGMISMAPDFDEPDDSVEAGFHQTEIFPK